MKNVIKPEGLWQSSTQSQYYLFTASQPSCLWYVVSPIHLDCVLPATVVYATWSDLQFIHRKVPNASD